MKKVVLKVRKVTSLFLVMIVLTGLTHQVQAAAPVVTLNSWDLVDSGKHLDWDGRTNYMQILRRKAFSEKHSRIME